MSDSSRRNFLVNSAKLLAGASVIGAMSNVSAEESKSGLVGNGIRVDAAAKDTCGTCMYWGGMRKTSADKKQVIAQSMGWCNNPDSMNYQKLTPADHVMKKPGMWKKWAVL